MTRLNFLPVNSGTFCSQQFRSFCLIIGLFLVSGVVISQPTGYGYGKQVTIDATEVIGGSSLADFPVMVRFMGASADADLRTTVNGGHVENNNGYDIIFTTDQTGASVLDHQIESYDGTTGEYVAWVRIPSLSNTVDTDIFMFYGNCAASTDPSTTNVWNSDYDAVHLLHDDFNDATGNGNTAVNSGSADASPALIGDGQTFGAGDYVQADNDAISAGQATLSAWIYPTGFTGNHHYIFGHTTQPPYGNRIQLYTNDANGNLDLGLGGQHEVAGNIYDFDTDNWYYVVLTWSGGNFSVYVNGVAQRTGTYTNLTNLVASDVIDIGNNGNPGTRNEPWIGDIDHVRLSNEIFSANWIRTEYNNQRIGSTFISLGSELSFPKTYYSYASGAWDDNNSWSLTPDGSSGVLSAGVWPGRYDNVVIQNGHTITINSTDDNNSCGISADDLGRSNVGNGADPFTGSDDPMFYQTGNIIIGNGATLSTSEELMIEGYTLVEDGGTLSSTEDVINLGYLEFSSTSTFDTSDDLILTGNSVTIMDNTGEAADDLYIEWTDATLCGSGVLNVGNGGIDPAIQYWNGATVAQICADIQVTCTTNCTGFPITGTGTFISGNAGLGGVGSQSSLQLWLRADDLGLTDGASVTSWSDVSGNSLTAVADGGGGTEPTFDANTANTILPAISFDGGDYLNLGQPAGLDFVPGTDSWSFFIVYNVSVPSAQGTFFSKADGNNGNRTYQYTIDDTGAPDAYFTSFIGGSYQDGGITGNTGNWMVSSHSNNTTTRDSWVNEGADISGVAIGTNTTGAVDVLIGARRQTAPSTGSGFHLDGSIAEIGMYDGEMTEVQRVIITNYLAAKYNISLTANDVYVEDDNGYDFDVIGVGQASDGSKHTDSRGLGITRIWNPSDLDNSEYLMIGHDNAPINNTTSDLAEIDGTIIEQRLSRIWSVSETGDVGNVFISIDLNTVDGNPLGSNLRLLIDRDGDFSTNDVTPIEGAFSGGIVVFSNVDFQDGDRFTLGNTDISMPLPIELLSFSAKPNGNGVLIEWETATEIDNDFFTIERSLDGVQWSGIMDIPGAGNSEAEIAYEVYDTRPVSGISYYRLKQTDFDGQFTYSSIVFVFYDQGISSFKVYPNPSSGQFHIQSSTEIPLKHLFLYTLTGGQLEGHIKRVGRSLIIDISDQPGGIYLLNFTTGNKSIGVVRLRKE